MVVSVLYSARFIVFIPTYMYRAGLSKVPHRAYKKGQNIGFQVAKIGISNGQKAVMTWTAAV